ncbi:MAG: hypothetical protein ACLFSE_15030 [Spirochaetia bacterium]
MTKNGKVTVVYLSWLGFIISLAVLGIFIYQGADAWRFQRKGVEITASVIGKDIKTSMDTSAGPGSGGIDIDRNREHIIRVSFFEETEDGSELYFSEIAMPRNIWNVIDEDQRLDIVYIPGKDHPEAMLTSRLEKTARSSIWKIVLMVLITGGTFFTARFFHNKYNI